jgi:Na+-transporting NADH:ubiquinone oxidoreductase subunit NqrF
MIKVRGLASGRIKELTYTADDLGMNLLAWLRSRGITVASSCDGHGVCKKCDIQNGWLTSELTLREFLQRQPDGMVEIGYL